MRNIVNQIMSLAINTLDIMIYVCVVAIFYIIGYHLCRMWDLPDFVVGMVSGIIAMGVSFVIYIIMRCA